MKCISDEQSQKYIDGEVSSKEEAFISEHLSVCEKCSKKIDDKKNFAIKIKKAINQKGNYIVDIPKFAIPVSQKKITRLKFKRYFYAVSAASMLFLTFLICQKETEDYEINFSYDLESEFNANLPVSEQEMVFQIIDSDGKFTTY